jgi:hypothetical protein
LDKVDASSNCTLDDDNNETGSPTLWDLHVGLKPSPLDGCASEGEITMEEDLPYGARKEVVSSMVNMIVNLDDLDPHNLEWLPAYEQRKLEARKKGLSSFMISISEALTLMSRKEESLFPWSRCFHKI